MFGWQNVKEFFLFFLPKRYNNIFIFFWILNLKKIKYKISTQKNKYNSKPYCCILVDC